MSKFNMNDRVRAYYVSNVFQPRGYDCYIDGWVSSMNGKLLQLNYQEHWFHEKQCRKLIKKSELHPQDARGYKNEIKEPKFKVGEKVYSKTHNLFGYVIKIFDDNHMKRIYLCYGLNNINTQFQDYEHSLTKVQDLSDSEPKFKIGDFVKGNEIHSDRICFGMVCYIGNDIIGVTLSDGRYIHIRLDTCRKLNIKCED